MQRLVDFKKMLSLTERKLFNTQHKMKSIDDIIQDARLIYKHSILAVQPDEFIRKTVQICSNKIQINEKQFEINNNVYIVGFGKAVSGMAVALVNILQRHIRSGIISIPYGMSDEILRNKLKASRIKVFEGAKNNIPDNDSLVAANEISKLIVSLEKSSLLFVLISGGGSALLPSPKPPLTLEEKQNVIKTLALKGATIEEINVIRKKLSLLKGGGLAQLAKPCQVISLILSDIIGDPLGLIASGPTVKNTDDPSLSLFIIEKYKIKDQLSQSALKLLDSNQTKNNFQDENFEFVSNFIIGSNRLALNAAAEKARELNYTPVIMTDKLCGLANDTGRNIIQLVNAAMQQKHNIVFQTSEIMKISREKALEILDKTKKLETNEGLCVLFGGETTVQVEGEGIGGRNQELALAASLELSKEKPENSVILLSAGTDGIDGPTDAAGAIATPFIVENAKNDGMDARTFLRDNDSYNFYSSLQNGLWHVKIGHTGTNVMDVIIVLVKK